jgi:hypothetical protein
MKKEVLIAIVLGIVVGLLITFGIYTANTALQRKSQKQQEQTTTQRGTDTNTQAGKIAVFSPEDNSIVATDTIQFSGTTTPNSSMVVFVNDEPYVTSSDATGNFAVELELEAGSNVITTIATDPNGIQEQEKRVVVFSTANLEESPTATPAAKPTPSPEI